MTGEDKKQHVKPMLTTEEQIERLKSKGVKFDACKEAEAKAYLEQKCYPFKALSYRKLFDKHVGGEKDGQYVDLDFDQLRLMAQLDQKLREVMLDMSLDIEHFMATSLLNQAVEAGEDGYSILADYLDSLSERSRAYVDRELETRMRDEYAGDMVEKYREDMPVWVFLSTISFGTFIGFTRYCAERWGDRPLLKRHYLLKHAKSIRNSSAHGSCILNDLSRKPGGNTKVGTVVTSAMSRGGISKRERQTRLANPRMQQISTMLFLYSEIVPKGETRDSRVNQLNSLYEFSNSISRSMPETSPAIASMRFMERLTKVFGLVE